MHSNRVNYTAYKLVKCVVVGDTAVGKTRLICSYLYNEPGKPLSSLRPRHHVPTVFAIDQYTTDQRISDRARFPLSGVNAELQIWDTFGEHIKNRKFAYQDAHVVVLCFNIAKAASLRNVDSKWYPEIKKYCPRASIILVGTQSDLRQASDAAFKNRVRILTLTDIKSNDLDGNGLLHASFTTGKPGCIAPGAGRQTSREINALAYLECSIVTKYGIDEVFETAVRAAFTRISRPFFSSHIKFVTKPLLQEPFLPQKDESPNIIVPEFNLQMDYSNFISDASCYDVAFIVEHELIYAHCVILLISSPVFYALFMHPRVLSRLGYEPLSLHSSTPSSLKFQSSRINGISDECVPQGFESIDLLSDLEEKCKVFVKVSGVRAEDFKHILKFLYSGDMYSVKDSIRLLQASNHLQTNIVSKYISGMIDHDLTATMQAQSELCVNRSKMLQTCPFYADVAFLIDNTIVEAHKHVLIANCSMMAGMFRHNSFKESAAQNCVAAALR